MEKLEEVYQKVSAIMAPHDVYLVGGCCRDALLGKEPHDWDGCTAASPEDIEVAVRAAGRRPYLAGARFGTVGFKVQLDSGEWIMAELTTFRKEVYEPNNRKPSVEFIDDLREDLSRRDVTIGAIAYKEGVFIDPFGGHLDLIAKKVKPVGDGNTRIKEDGLRMLRAARLAAQLGFEVDANFIGVIRKHAYRISTVSRERWCQELDKLLVASHAEYGIAVLLDTGIMKYILPEVYAMMDHPGIAADTLESLRSTVDKADARWAALLMDVGKPYVAQTKRDKTTYPHYEQVSAEIAAGIAWRLKWSRERRENVVAAVKRGW